MSKRLSESRILLFMVVASILVIAWLTSACGRLAVAEPNTVPATATETAEPTFTLSATATAVPPTETVTPIPSPTPLPLNAPVFEVPEGISNLYIEYIIDASGSMLELLDDGVPKRDAARDYLIESLLAYNAETHLGLRSYGHRLNWEEDEAASCEDIELIASVDIGQMNLMAQWLSDFETLGMTPLHASVEQALEDFDTSDPDRINNLVLISDGIETCSGNPCELVQLARKEGVNFVLHVVGVAVDLQTRTQLSCMAEKGGGVYYDVNNSDDFQQALSQIQEEIQSEEKIISYADATATAQPTATRTPRPTWTPRPTNTPLTPTNTPLPLPTNTAAPPPTSTSTPAATSTSPVPPTDTPSPGPTGTIEPTATGASLTGCVLPDIVDFHAAPPPQGSTARFTLHYTVQGAGRVEIFGNQLDPNSGTFDVWDDNKNYWVLWAKADGMPDDCFAEKAIQVDPDSITPPGTGLKDVDVDRRDITISVRDHASIDGDRIDLFVNGQKVLSNYTLTSSPYGVPVKLRSGDNEVTVTALNEGSSSPNTVEVSVSNVVRGSSVQVSTGLLTGQSEIFTIRAP